MVIKHAKLLKITGIFNVLYLVFILLFESPKYNYPRFTLNTSAVGVDLVMEKYTNDIKGFSVGVGSTAGGDVHVNETKTTTIGKPFRSLFKVVKDWLGL